MAVTNPYQLTSADKEELGRMASSFNLSPEAGLAEANQFLVSGQAASMEDLRRIANDKLMTKSGVAGYTPAGATSVSTPASTVKADTVGYTAFTDTKPVSTAAVSKAATESYSPSPFKGEIQTAGTTKADTVGYTAATYTPEKYKADQYKAEGFDAIKRDSQTYDAKQAALTSLNVTPEQLVEDRIQGLLKKGSPLLTLQETKARQGMAAKGLLSSSMAEGEALRAVTESARDIATTDAGTMFRAAEVNAQQANTLAQFNVREINAAAAFNAEAANVAKSDNQRVLNSAAEFLANAKNAAAANNSAAINDASRFSAEASNQASAAYALAQNNERAFLAQAKNAASAQFAADANAAARQASADANSARELMFKAETDAAAFRADSINRANLANTQDLNAAARQAIADAQRLREMAVTSENNALQFSADAKNAASIQSAADANAAARQSTADAQRSKELAIAAQNDANKFQADAYNRRLENERLITADKDLQTLNNRAKVTEQATNIFQNTTDNIAKIMADSELSAEAKQAAVNGQKQSLTETITFLENASKVTGLKELVTFTTATVTPPPPATVTPPPPAQTNPGGLTEEDLGELRLAASRFGLTPDQAVSEAYRLISEGQVNSMDDIRMVYGV